MPEVEIDAGKELEERDRERHPAPGEVEGARGRAELGPPGAGGLAGARTFLVVTGLIAAALAALVLVKARAARKDRETADRGAQASNQRVERRVPALKLAPVLPTPPPPEKAIGTPSLPDVAAASEVGVPPTARTPPVAGAQAGAAQAVPRAVEILQRRLARGFGAGDGAPEGGQAGQAAAQPSMASLAQAPPGSTTTRPGALEEKLEPVELKMAAAGVLPDRDYLLTQGAMLDCVLETRVISTVAGMTSCHLTRDVYSTNGHVVLLDRGARVVGRYQGGVQQGEARIFVLWTRVETPTGVVVDFASPGTGPLGEAGLGGSIDTHFWDCFGAAILLSIIEGTADAASARAAGNTAGPTIAVGNTATAGKDVVAKSLEPTVSIPPTLYKNQGDRVGIFVARDLDFRRVYGLDRAARPE